MAETSEIISRLDLESFYRERLDRFRVSQNGNQAMARCPTGKHRDKNPSCSINLKTSQWHCFGCHEKGDAFEMLMLLDNISFGEAKDSLAKLAGVSNGYSNGKSKPMPKKKVLVLSEVRLDLIGKMMNDDGEKTIEELLEDLIQLKDLQISLAHITGLPPTSRQKWIQLWSNQQTGTSTTSQKIAKMLTLVSLA